MILKHRDREILRFEWTEPQGVHIVSVNEAEKKFLPLEMGGKVTDEALWGWLTRRTVPRGRKYILAALNKLKIASDDVRAIVEFSRGLSLNDVYWTVDESFEGKWQDYNLYDNEFSEDVAVLALTGMGVAPEEKHTSSPEFSTNGMLRKCWRRINGRIFLYKGGTEGAINAGFEPYSEFYAAQIAEKLGLPHVEYGLAKFKKVLCSTCPLFTCDKYGYIPAGRLIDKQSALEDPRFAHVFLFDALIFNTDRHMGNFGFIVDNDTNKIAGVAPIFDNGYGLFSLATYRPEMAQYHEFDDLRKYLSRVGPALYDRWLDYPKQMPSGLTAKLALLRNFRFKRHKHYNLDDERLSAIERFIRKRASDILEYGKAADRLLEVGVKSKNPGLQTAGNMVADADNVEIPGNGVGVNSRIYDSLAYQIKENMSADRHITVKEIADLLQVESRTIERRIKTLREAGEIRRVGADKNGYWEVVQQ